MGWIVYIRLGCMVLLSITSTQAFCASYLEKQKKEYYSHKDPTKADSPKKYSRYYKGPIISPRSLLTPEGHKRMVESVGHLRRLYRLMASDDPARLHFKKYVHYAYKLYAQYVAYYLLFSREPYHPDWRDETIRAGTEFYLFYDYLRERYKWDVLAPNEMYRSLDRSALWDRI